MSDDLQLDIASAIARIEQAYAERGTPLGEFLLERLQADARRLRGHLTPEWRSRLEDIFEAPEPHVPEGQALGVTDEHRTDPRKAEGDIVDMLHRYLGGEAGHHE